MNHEVGSSNLSGRAIKTTTYSHLKNSILPLKRNPPTGLGSQGDKSTTWAVVWRLFSVVNRV